LRLGSRRAMSSTASKKVLIAFITLVCASNV
jgi:hypothetical protein